MTAPRPDMTVLVYGNVHQDASLPRVGALLEALAAAGIGLEVEGAFARYLRSHGALPQQAAICPGPGGAGRAALALSFGGDGTLLRAASATAPAGIPVMGVNTGHLGFLAGASIDDIPPSLPAMLQARAYDVEPRSMIRAERPGAAPCHALNEVALLKADSAQMLTIDTCLGHSHLATIQADGLLVATPTGSTAYNLSVGGPIIDPQSPVWAVTPVAPHSLTMRPVVVPDAIPLTATAASRSGSLLLSVDGRAQTVPSGTRITVSRAPFPALLASLPGHGYLHNLRTKLSWGR